MKNNGVFIEDEPSKVSMVLCDIETHVKNVAKEYKKYAMQSVNGFRDIVKKVRKDTKRFKVTRKIKLKQSWKQKSFHALEFYFKDIADNISCTLITQPYCDIGDVPDYNLFDGYHLILKMEKDGLTDTLYGPDEDFEELYESCKKSLLDKVEYNRDKKHG